MTIALRTPRMTRDEFLDWTDAQRAKGPSTDRLVPGVVVVFEVLSPSSGRSDRIEKLLEYRAVPIRRYVILEHTSAGMTVYARARGEDPWIATALTGDDVLSMPEIGIEVPVAEFYEGTDLPGGVVGQT